MNLRKRLLALLEDKLVWRMCTANKTGGIEAGFYFYLSIFIFISNQSRSRLNQFLVITTRAIVSSCVTWTPYARGEIEKSDHGYLSVVDLEIIQVFSP